MTDELKAWASQYGDYLSEADKALIDELISQGERFQNAVDEMNSYLETVFGNTADSIADKMITAFIESGDAATNFADIVADSAKTMAKSWVVDKLIKDVFNDDAEKRMSELIGANNIAGAVNYYNSLIEQANASAPAINEFLRNINVDWAGESERTGLSEGVAQASQDSIDALSGMMTVVQGNTFEIKETVASFKVDYDMLISNTAALLQHTQGIHLDTSEMKEIQAEIAELSRSIRTNVSTMVDRGVKMLG